MGLPDVPYYPIVDPRGFVTPQFDGWSLDFWGVTEKGEVLAPSKLAEFEQELSVQTNLRVRSRATWPGAAILSETEMRLADGQPVCCVQVSAPAASCGFLAVAIRPYNPEGISFVEQITLSTDGREVLVNRRHPVRFDRAPQRVVLFRYNDGDVSQRLRSATPAGTEERRLDAGAVGSLVADYPLQLFAPGDPRILRTADFLRDLSSFNGGFFQNMIHSGINPYLTLHLAQVPLRAGQFAETWQLLERVAELASPIGQWPEAIHPRTLGGCMGDGQHIWAAAERALLVRNCFVREEPGHLVLASGVRPEWWAAGASFGPTLTPFGTVAVRIEPTASGATVAVDGN